MRNLLVIIIFFSFFPLGKTQNNLIPNPSFEEFYNCPNLLVNFEGKNWYSPNGNTPDYLHICGSNLSGIPYSWVGYQFQNSGLACSGFCTFNIPGTNNSREYLAVKLIDSLISGEKYRVSFFINFCNTNIIANDDIGIYFSNDSIFHTDIGRMPFVPQFEMNYPNGYFIDTLNWYKVQGEYTAQGGEKYIAIGNFRDTGSTTWDTVYSNNISYMAYYYFDDFYLGLVEDTVISEISFYPNPNNGHFTLNYNLGEGDNGFAEIYNSIGQKVYQRKLSHNNGTENFELNLSAGCYLMQIVSGEAVLRNKKLIIVR